MTNSILFDLQAAAMAMQVNDQAAAIGGNSDGASFSDILAGVTAGTNGTDVTNADGTAVDSELAGLAETIEEELSGTANEIIKAIENADDGVKKALKQLLETVVDAIKGSRDKGERKTDIFLIISDGSGLADIMGDEDSLVSMEILNQLGITLDTDTDKAVQEILDSLETVVEKIFPKDEDTDENTAADVLAALLGVEPEELETMLAGEAPEEAVTEAVETAAETLKAPMEILSEQKPEAADEAAGAFEKLAAVQTEDTGTAAAPETVTVSFSVPKVNDAQEQVASISNGTQTADTDEPAVIAVNVQTEPESGADAETEQGAGTEQRTVTERETEAVPSQTKTADTGYAESIVTAADIPEQTDVSVRETAESGAAEFTRDITAWHADEQVAGRLELEISGFGMESGTKELVMILEPEELGQVAVKIVKEGTEVSIVLSAQYSDVGRLINERAQQLGISLSDQNTEVKDVQVVEPGSAAEQMGLNFTDKGFSFNGGTQDYRGASGNSYTGLDGNDEETIAEDIGEIRMREARLWTTA